MSIPPTEIAAAPAGEGAAALTAEQHVPTLLQRFMDTGILSEEKPETGDEPEKKEPAEPAKADPTAAPDPKEKKDPAAPATEPGMKIRSAKLQRPTLKFKEEPKPAPAAAAVPAPPAKPDPEFEKTLDEDERDMLTDARDIESQFPDRHKGLAAKAEKFLRDHKAWLKEHGDEDTPEYRAFLQKNQPRLSRQEIRTVQEERVKSGINKEWQGKYDDLRHQIYTRDEEPKITAEVQKHFQDMANLSIPEEVSKHIREMTAKHGDKGFEEAKKLYGVEIETAQAVLASAADDIGEFIRITRVDPTTRRPVSSVANDPSNPKYEQHARLSDAIESIAQDFKRTAPVEQQYRNGKWFVTRDEFNRLVPEDRAKAWSFTNAEIIDRMKAITKDTVGRAIKERAAYLEGRGYKRTAPAAPAVEKTNPTPRPTPRLPAGGPVASPGASDNPPAKDAQTATLLGNLTR